MAIDIKLKRSSVPGKIPTTSSLELGELALNTYDGKVYMKKQVGNVQSVIEVGSSGSSSVTASYAINAGTAQTSSYSFNAVSSSYALTASFALNGGGGGISAIYIADEGNLQGTASYFDFIGAGVTASVSNGTASITISGGGGGGTGASSLHTQSIAATTWSFNHNLGSQYINYDVYDSGGNAIIPANVAATNSNLLTITFAVATSGYAVATIGGAQGVQGIQGAQGTQGIEGLIGIQGTQRIQGIQGIQGTQGTQGTMTCLINKSYAISCTTI